MPKEKLALVSETWAQAAANVSSHQRDYVIEVLKELRESERAADKVKTDRASDEKKKDEKP